MQEMHWADGVENKIQQIQEDDGANSMQLLLSKKCVEDLHEGMWEMYEWKECLSEMFG